MLDNIITNPIITKGRGAQINPKNRFDKSEYLLLPTHPTDDEDNRKEPTQYVDVFPKTIVNRVDSPDVPADWSMNPYQGCEHGCVYCYARNSHEYWGYSAGKDFEQKVMVKRNADQLLQRKLRSKQWKVSPIMLSGNTDCYQPAERTQKITRSLLKVLLKHKHPVGIITKNNLILRDMDLLKELAAHGLVHVHMSITTLDEKLRRSLEPRTSSAKLRLRTVEELSNNGIPVNVMFAPIIPGLNSDEVFDIAHASKNAGAHSLAYTMLRLNGVTGLLFEDWLRKFYPLKANRVLNLVAMAQGGKVNNTVYGERMKGKGVMAENIKQQFKLARKKLGLDKPLPAFNLDLFQSNVNAQLNLF